MTKRASSKIEREGFYYLEIISRDASFLFSKCVSKSDAVRSLKRLLNVNCVRRLEDLRECLYGQTKSK